MVMKRRDFIKSLGAAAGAMGLAPMVPMSALASAPSVPASTYAWAETIVRAHNSCTIPMLQRHLKLDIATANAVKSQLLKNGIISGKANAYGVHQAIKPLFEGAFIQPSNTINTVEKAHKSVTEIVDRHSSNSDDAEQNLSPEKQDIPLDDWDEEDIYLLGTDYPDLVEPEYRAT